MSPRETALAVILLGFAVAHASGQEADPIAIALRAEVRLGSGAYVASCRNAPGGCEARIDRLVRTIRAASEAHNVDPWILASMARVESGLNANATGPRGEATVFQLNPRRGDIRGNESEREAAFIAAGILSRSIAMCGSINAGLGMYNTGRCAPEVRYVYNVRRVYARLRRRAGR